ncbi:DUF503 domain-containing protein [Rhodococcus sp. ACPA4]|jgi:uncharacterized protein YlxP (DUF503 family)|uniref:DUF503 domain-containing protein n=2 Tax=Nocardiaceae TaxID=85025 RepID=A0A652YKM4_NOCGL|nr:MULTISPECIES: DUF503 domain-containing protein [Rhodococcus]NMD61752.1 DUF503 domain-containing protein [Nocardia globerula]KJF22201.1 hypothetical protein SZ00_02849 [Rhodococcus sp. AD45]MCE4268691.1 DUF503 domain-containing protein [Rhodococcus globerulus]MDV6265616.1 DUF503 domain-containing protein [Rhodococcus globerulus]MDV8067860.1 DUF503 domain-containing protein [Rhodococcus sp. IEGM 1366]
MFVGALEFDILFGDVHSLKEKRSLVSPILTELRRFGISAAEAGEQGRLRRALVGVAAVSSSMDHLHDVLDRCERAVAARPEMQLLAVRRRVFGPED